MTIKGKKEFIENMNVVSYQLVSYTLSTALMFASEHGKLDIVKYLVEEKSASLEIVNKPGK